MAKVQEFFIVAIIISTINGYPLEESSSPASSTDSKLHDLKVNPLLSGQIQQQNKNVSSQDEDTKDDDNSTNPTFIEETFIEVLLPGTPLLNSSVLESLLKSSTAANDTLKTDRSKRDSPNNENAPTSVKEERPSSTSRTIVPALYSQQKYQVRPARDASSENDDDSSEENTKPLSTFTSGYGSTVEPVLYSGATAQNEKKETNSAEDSSSDEDSSEEKEVKPQITTSTLQSSGNRVSRDTSGKDTKPANINVPPGVLNPDSLKPGSTTESVVFVTPQAKKL